MGPLLNMGGVDRALRAVIGIILLSLCFLGPKSLWGLVGLIPLLTAVVGFCPPYAVLGFNTLSCCQGKADREGAACH